MTLQIERAPVETTQRFYARLAGILFLWLIVNIVVSGLIFPSIPVSGTFSEAAGRIAASDHLYRLGFSFEVIETLSATVLAFALFVILKPVHSSLALLAMIFWLQDTCLAGVVQMCGFMRLNLYTSFQTVGPGTVPAQALADLMRSIARTTENIGGISFGIALFIFFYLFFRSRYIPRILSAFGLFATVVWIGLYFATLVFPEHRSVFQLHICFPLVGLVNVTMGVWLTLFAVSSHRLHVSDSA